MTTTEIATLTPAETAARIAEHLAARLQGLDIVDGAFVRTTVTIGQDGYLVVDITRWEPEFCGPDTTLRVLLHPTLPVNITPATAPEVELTEPGSAVVVAASDPLVVTDPEATQTFATSVGWADASPVGGVPS